MATSRTTVRTRARKTGVRKGLSSTPGAGKAAKAGRMPRRPHEFVVNHFQERDFKPDGLRSYAHYRDLGIKCATHGMAVAHVIRLQGPCNPQLVSKLHRHEADFQMVYVLRGSVTTEFEGHGQHTMTAGDAWLQPRNIKHKVLDYSDDCELLEIVMPADFKTVELEKS